MIKLNRQMTFIDTETTGLDFDKHEVWELSAIARKPGVDYEYTTTWQIRPNLTLADPEALKINRFHERFMVPDDADAVRFVEGDAEVIDRQTAMFQIGSLLKDSILAGSNTAFDATMTRKLLGGQAPWHYRVVNVIELAVGALLNEGVSVDFPWDSYAVSRAVGIEPPDRTNAHTAWADARWAQEMFDCLFPTSR